MVWAKRKARDTALCTRKALWQVDQCLGHLLIHMEALLSELLADRPPSDRRAACLHGSSRPPRRLLPDERREVMGGRQPHHLRESAAGSIQHPEETALVFS